MFSPVEPVLEKSEEPRLSPVPGAADEAAPNPNPPPPRLKENPAFDPV